MELTPPRPGQVVGKTSLDSTPQSSKTTPLVESFVFWWVPRNTKQVTVSVGLVRCFRMLKATFAKQGVFFAKYLTGLYEILENFVRKKPYCLPSIFRQKSAKFLIQRKTALFCPN